MFNDFEVILCSQPAYLSETMATCPICLETIFPVEEVSLSLCKHYLHLECYNKIQTRNRCCMCRRYEPTECDMNHLLIICEDPRNSCEIEIREQLNPVGQQLLKDFEDGIISAQNLEDRANEILEDQMRVDCD